MASRCRSSNSHWLEWGVPYRTGDRASSGTHECPPPSPSQGRATGSGPSPLAHATTGFPTSIAIPLGAQSHHLLSRGKQSEQAEHPELLSQVPSVPSVSLGLWSS